MSSEEGKDVKYCPECAEPLTKKGRDIYWCMWHGHFTIQPMEKTLAEGVIRFDALAVEATAGFKALHEEKYKC